MSARRWLVALLVLVVAAAASFALITYIRRARTVADVVAIYGPAARQLHRPGGCH